MNNKKCPSIILVLAIVAVGAAVLIVDSKPRTVGEEIGVQDFETRDNPDQFPASLDSNGFNHTAIVNYSSKKNRLVIFGQINSGSRSCRNTYLKQATLDKQKETLTIIINDGYNEKIGGCTSEIALVYYRVNLSISSVNPNKVTVIHQDTGEEEFSKTFNLTSSHQKSESVNIHYLD